VRRTRRRAESYLDDLLGGVTKRTREGIWKESKSRKKGP
jgi:hypothetical protein